MSNIFRAFTSLRKDKNKGPEGGQNDRTNAPHSPSTILPRNILAFRTITTLLHLIQQERPFQILESLPMAPADILELKVANAVSTVAVASFDVVAVSTKRTMREIQVVACAHDDSPISTPSNIQSPLLPPSPPPPPPPSRLNPLSLLCQTWHWSFTRNPRKDEDMRNYNLSDPHCIIPSIPTVTPILAAENGLTLKTNADLKEYLNVRWNCFNTTSTLATHMWTLQRILTMNKSDISNEAKEETSDLLRRYVIATCYPKMLRRLSSQLSRPYIKSLKEVSASNIRSHFTKDTLANSHPQEDLSPSEIQDRDARLVNDKEFLTHFAIPKRLATPIPNLSIQAALATQSAKFELYTRDTCVEFHLLLIEYLERLYISLTKLAQSTSNLRDFNRHLVAVLLSSCALQRIANGSALQRHLRVIGTLINLNNHSQFNNPSPVQHDNPEIIEDEELEAVQPFVIKEDGQKILLSQSYEDWLRLMLVHFDAVDILVDYVKGKNFQHADISAQILVAPPVDARLLSLKELLEDSNFPTTSNSTSIQSNEDILKFFESATSDGVGEFLRHIKGVSTNWESEQHRLTVSCVAKMKAATANQIAKTKPSEPRLPVSWIEGVDKLKSMLDLDPCPETEITDLIATLKKNAIFFGPAGRFQTKMKTFSGSLHCEVCLASLLGGLAKNITINSECNDVIRQLEGFGRIIGISKRCCPTCRYLLYLLKKDAPQPFLTRGFHNTISPCTLPPWLPGDIVDAMNDHFGDMLRSELVNFVSRSDFSQPRPPSSGSDRLSFDLTEGQGTHGSQPVTAAHFDSADWDQYYAVDSIDF